MARNELDLRLFKGASEMLTDSVRNKQIIYSPYINKILFPIEDDTYVFADNNVLSEEEIDELNAEIKIRGESYFAIQSLNIIAENIVYYNLNEVTYAANSADYEKMKRERRIIK